MSRRQRVGYLAPRKIEVDGIKFELVAAEGGNATVYIRVNGSLRRARPAEVRIVQQHIDELRERERVARWVAEQRKAEELAAIEKLAAAAEAPEVDDA